MKDPLLIVDSNYIAHRAFYALGALAHGSVGTGTVFGFLREVITLQDMFQTGRCAFVFDHPAPKLRHKHLPTYKSTRKKRHAEELDEEKAARRDFYHQVFTLYKEHLPALGFKNVFALRGYEADDIIASIAANLPPNEEAIIIGSDKDLWQCIRKNVVCYSPHKRATLTRAGFIKEWGLTPDQWGTIKAIAGCSTDDVPGVAGVGEPTAAKYLRGELGTHTKTFNKIEHSRPLWESNLRIVRLPYAGTPVYEIQPDEVTEDRWVALVDKLGMKSLGGTLPRAATKNKRGRKRHASGFGFSG